MYIGFAYKFIIQDNQMKKSRIIVLSLLLTLLIGTLSFSVMARSDSDQLSFFNQREGIGHLINPLRGRQHGDENWPKLQGHRLDFEAMDETEIEAFQAEIVAERKERLEQAVKAGLLSQEEADEILTRIDALDFGQNMGGGLMLGLKRQQKGRGRNFRLTQPE